TDLSLGPCPAPKVQPNFNLQQYLGKWYEIEKLPAAFERGKCIEANYAIRKDVSLCVSVRTSFRTAEGTAVVQDLREPCQTWSHPYLVLTTDYTTLSVVYSCTDILRLFHVEYAWILGRSRFLPPETVDVKKRNKSVNFVFNQYCKSQYGLLDFLLDGLFFQHHPHVVPSQHNSDRRVFHKN
uniref:Apolipoprotein Db n=1 Tax=Lates calcarifer TaxID=8187 RepID=A0A4W6DFH1_LATCA